MNITLYAQPYDISAAGFYFTSADDYVAKAKANRNDYGGAVEEYEIQFIDGAQIDCALARSWEINQANFPAYLEAVANWNDQQKTKFIIAVGNAVLIMPTFQATPMRLISISMTWRACSNWLSN